MAFYDVVAGNPTNAADLNQLVDALNGSVASNVQVLGSNSSSASTTYAAVLTAIFQSAPSGGATYDSPYIVGKASGDTLGRVSLYQRASDAFAGIRAGNGTNITAHLYAQSSGWKIDESLTIGTSLTVVGGLIVAAPPQLASGYQEQGTCGFSTYANSTSVYTGYGVNFKTALVNVPTSITLSATDSSGVTTTSADHITRTGFVFQILPSTTGGYVKWFGTYTTAGNCIRAVDVTAGTFDHHCDACGTLTTGRSIQTDLHVSAASSNAPGEYAMSAICPHCGASEQFNTALAAAAERDATPSSDGSTTYGEQATFIRQLQQARGLQMSA